MNDSYTYQMRQLAEEVRAETNNEVVKKLLDILVGYTGGDFDREATHCGLLAVIIASGSTETVAQMYEGIRLVSIKAMVENMSYGEGE